jgi:hypothetical protein
MILTRSYESVILAKYNVEEKNADSRQYADRGSSHTSRNLFVEDSFFSKPVVIVEPHREDVKVTKEC